MYYLCIRLQINISVLFCSVLEFQHCIGGGGGGGKRETTHFKTDNSAVRFKNTEN